MPYRAPELFHIDTYSTVDERVDIWVSFLLFLINLFLTGKSISDMTYLVSGEKSNLNSISYIVF